MLSFCAVLAVFFVSTSANAIINTQENKAQNGGVFVPQESTFEMGTPPPLHPPEKLANMMDLKAPMEQNGKPDMELQATTAKPRAFVDRKFTIVFPKADSLSPFHAAPAVPSNPPMGQQDAKLEAPTFVQQPGGPNGPSDFPNKDDGWVAFPKQSELKPFHFGPQHKMRLQHQQSGRKPVKANAPKKMETNMFVGQDAPPMQFQKPIEQPQWASQPAPTAEFTNGQFPFGNGPFQFQSQDAPLMNDFQPQWTMQNAPAPMRPFRFGGRRHSRPFPPPPPPPPPMGDYDSFPYGPAPEYDLPPMESYMAPVDDVSPYSYGPMGNSIEEMRMHAPVDMDMMPEYGPPPPPPPMPRYYRYGRWSRPSRYYW